MTTDSEIDCIKEDILRALGTEFEELTYKEAGERLGIPESNYWRFVNHGTIGGRSLFRVIAYMISRGIIFLPRG